MSYRIDPSRNLDEELKRIGRSQLVRAGERLTVAEGDENEAIHDARKRFKKVRGLYRLVRTAAPDFYARENARVRELARTLSGVRDATALVETVEDLRSHLSPEIAPESLSAVHQGLVARRDRIVAEQTDLRQRMQAATRTCEEALQALEGLALDCGSKKEKAAVVAAGWRRICAQGRRALKAATETGEDAAFHDLRKRVKYHWMHVRLLEAAWPAAMRLRRREAKQVGDLVGDEHNLSLLAAVIAEEPETAGTEADVALLMRLVSDRRSQLRAESIRRAGGLFRDPPKREEKRIALLWRQAS